MGDDTENVIHVSFGRQGSSRDSTGDVREVPSPEVALGEGLGSSAADPFRALYGCSEVARLFRCSQSKLRYWDRCGFIAPSARVGQRKFYSFQDLVSIRAAKALLERGVPFREVRRAVDSLRQAWPRVARPLSELRVVADGQTVVVKDDAGTGYEPATGQLVMDFQLDTLRDDVVRTLHTRDPSSQSQRSQRAYERYLEGCRLDEDDASLEKAEQAYRAALQLDPSLANAWTNLGNMRYRKGALEEAENLYHRALAIDPAQPEARYNLGFLAYERGEPELAVGHFEAALATDPSFADAHFNLAMAYEDTRRFDDARRHWNQYLQLDPQGPWAEIARRHLQRR